VKIRIKHATEVKNIQKVELNEIKPSDYIQIPVREYGNKHAGHKRQHLDERDHNFDLRSQRIELIFFSLLGQSHDHFVDVYTDALPLDEYIAKRGEDSGKGQYENHRSDYFAAGMALDARSVTRFAVPVVANGAVGPRVAVHAQVVDIVASLAGLRERTLKDETAYICGPPVALVHNDAVVLAFSVLRAPNALLQRWEHLKIIS
jgi:hypothetical protein